MGDGGTLRLTTAPPGATAALVPLEPEAQQARVYSVSKRRDWDAGAHGVHAAASHAARRWERRTGEGREGGGARVRTLLRRQLLADAHHLLLQFLHVVHSGRQHAALVALAVPVRLPQHRPQLVDLFANALHPPLLAGVVRQAPVGRLAGGPGPGGQRGGAQAARVSVLYRLRCPTIKSEGQANEGGATASRPTQPHRAQARTHARTHARTQATASTCAPRRYALGWRNLAPPATSPAALAARACPSAAAGAHALATTPGPGRRHHANVDRLRELVSRPRTLALRRSRRLVRGGGG